ncbi:tetratricopeptide repeat protein, partial [bacterium]|nr:tetratricopeptide repeat protein [bacterium]
LELAEEVDPQEEGFISRIALEGRLAQLEVLVGSRRFTAARDLSRALAAHESKNAHAHWLLAEALAGLGDDDGAFDAAQKAARLAPTDARAVRAYAQALSRKGKLPEACLAMRRIVGTAKGEPRDSVFLADLLRRQGEEAHAKKIMEELVARDPQSLEPMRQASLARAAAGDLEGAADELESLSKKEKPPRPITLAVATELARAVEAAGDRAPPSAVVGCARALDASGKTIAAVRLLGPLVLRDPGAIDARRALGLAYSKLGAAPLAEEHLRAVASRPGAGADECKALGELALERGDAEGAVRVLVRARDLRPDDVSIRRALARAHEAAGEFQKALEEIEVACTDAPDDKDLDAIHEALSERALAAKLTALEARVREAPDDTQAWLDLGIALFEKGEASRAFDSLAKAVRDPYLVPRVVELVEFLREELDDQRPAVVLLVELHRKAQSPQKAIEVLEAFLKEHTDDGLRLELLELYWKGKRIPAAVEGLLAVLGKAEKDRLPPAIALAEKVLESESQNDLARAIARAKRKTGDLAGAARAFEKYLEAVPGDREARRELASALEDGLNIEEALAALRPLVQDGVPTPDELSYAASLMVHLEKHAEAVPLLKRALELRPDDRGMKERLERAEGAVRDREAERLAAQVRKAGASASEDDCRRLASLYAESGKQKEALELLRVLPGIPAGDDEAVFLRFQAEQLARSGRIDKAEAALRQLCKVLAYVPGSEQEKTMLYRIASLYERSNDRRSARRVYLELVGRDPNYRDAYSKLEAQAEAGAAVESEAALEERRFADLIETGAPRDLKTIFDALGGMDLALDATLLADARAKLSAGAQSE